jgi:hypothetical protein
MQWGIIRVVIFFSAFLFGVLATGIVNANSPQGEGEAAKSLVVGCDHGTVIVTPMKTGNAVQLQCVSSEMFVVGEGAPKPEKIPDPVRHLGPIAMIQRP